MSPVLTQRPVASSGVSRAVPNCQPQALQSGASIGNASLGSPIASGSSPAGVRRAVEQVVFSVALPSAVGIARVDGMDDIDAAGTAPSSPSTATAAAQPSLHPNGTDQTACSVTLASTKSALDRPPVPVPASETMLRPCGSTPSGQQSHAAAALPAPVAVTFNPVVLCAPQQEDSGLLDSACDVSHDGLGTATTFIPLMRAPPSPTHSSAPCSPASSVVLSGPCRSSVASTYRLTSSSGMDSSTACAFATNASAVSAAASPSAVGAASAASADTGCPLVNALLGPCFVADFGTPPSIRQRRTVTAAPPQHRQQNHGGFAAAAATSAQDPEEEARAAVAPLPPQSYFASATASGCSSRRSSLRDQNSVTIKASTVVKDAAGAIDKILSRGVTALVTALRPGGPPYNGVYDSLNQAVKAIAVARQYAKETGPAGAEVTFLPFHRNDANERPDPCRFAFLVFPVPHLDEQLKTVDETVLNVARGSDVHKMASAIIAVMLDRGQAVMKAAGAEAIFVAMSAVVNARHRLIQKHGFDLMLAAAWITEDTSSTMGRESKFLR
ncbi:hypothetical protein PLESTM_001290800 [Pleodorina starrii]|nr:hypothetical protein PLESTM_001290800 [Pleodorina starrii]